MLQYSENKKYLKKMCLYVYLYVYVLCCVVLCCVVSCRVVLCCVRHIYGTLSKKNSVSFETFYDPTKVSVLFINEPQFSP